VVTSGAVFGLLSGGTAGSGVVLISILLAAGLSGPAVIATDAAISLALGVAKVSVYQAAGALPSSSWIMALLVGVFALPGAFIAKRLTARLPGHWHIRILDGVVVLGGALLVVQGLRELL
jgi:uncharacterized membrane protein YfcA